jgi:hypothetical protein
LTAGSARFLAVGLGAAAVGALLALATRQAGSVSSFSPETGTPAKRQPGPAPAPASRGPVPPRFNPALPALQLVPGQPGYDPSKLGLIVPLWDLFDQEPRHAPWAGPMERFIRDELTARLPRELPDLRLRAVECRTAVCKVTWEGMSGQQQAVGRALQGVLSGGSGSWRRDRDEWVVTFQGGEFMSDVPLNDPDATIEKIRRHRAYWEELTRRGRLRGADGGTR